MITKLRSFLKVLRETKNPLKFIAAQLLVKSGLNGFFTVKMDGYKIQFSRAALALTLFVDSKERHEDENFLHEILKPGQLYVDIGANIGTLALAASAIVGKGGKVIAIEAHPVTFKYLNENVTLNNFSNITLINSAVGDKAGDIYFSNINSDDQNKVLLHPSKGIRVKVNTLDELLAGQPVINLLKIDVEGYEKFVLLGAAATLQKTKIVYFESWEKHFNGFGYLTADVIDIFKQSGFKVYKPAGKVLTVVTAPYESIICENLVALKNTDLFCKEYGYTIRQMASP